MPLTISSKKNGKMKTSEWIAPNQSQCKKNMRKNRRAKFKKKVFVIKLHKFP
jgi:hypothetical protein